MPAAVDHLMRAHDGYVRAIATKVLPKAPPCVTLDELYVAGLKGLWHAAEKWRASDGAKFTTYAREWIIGAMRDWLRRADYRHGGTRGPRVRVGKQPKCRQFARLRNDLDARRDDIGTDELIPDPHDDIAAADARDAAGWLMRRLNAKSRAVAMLCLGEGWTGPEVAPIVGIPTNMVWYWLRDARRKLVEYKAKVA